MEKPTNRDYLVSIAPARMKEKSEEELLAWLFRGEERTVKACARVAYRDIQRNLGGIGKMSEQEKMAWREETEKLIACCIEDLFQQNVSKQEKFDDWHRDTCEKIIKISAEHGVPKWIEKDFSYGLAQKWLNMTIKNALIMGQKICEIKQYLHIPVDSYIMEMASCKLRIETVDRNCQFKLYSAGISKPWSRWDYGDYVAFQEKIREATACPLEWEHGAWLEAKEMRAGSAK